MARTVEQHRRLLVADDEEAILSLYQQAFFSPTNVHPAVAGMKALAAELFDRECPSGTEQADYDVTFCRQGEEAIEAVEAAVAREQPYSVAFLDVRMPPGLDGVRSAERIRAIDPHLHFVLVTGYSDVEPATIGKRVPPADRLLYLQKPIQPFEIRQLAATLSVKWQVERELWFIQAQMKALARAGQRQPQGND